MDHVNTLHKDLLNRVAEAAVEFVHLQFTDIPGSVKSVTLPAQRLRECLEDGVWFDGSSVEGLARVAESDLYLVPDPTTFGLVHWEETPTARLICDLRLPDGQVFPADPRQALKRMLAEARDLGFDYQVATELEFFVFLNPQDDGPQRTPLEPVDRGGYFEVPGDRIAQLCGETVQALKQFGFGVETTHTEVGPGQYEIDLVQLDALAAADAIMVLKSALRALGRRAGFLVSFMPKPIEAAAGSGLHLHQVLVDRETRSNAFYAANDQYRLSEAGQHFIAGQLAHARGMCAVIAPQVNSYKRLMGGAEAPARISWARINGAALIRVPELSQRTGVRVEIRAPDPSCNPYLALAALLGAGLDGIRTRAPLPEPVEEALFTASDELSVERLDPLPETLQEALAELNWDPVVRTALGEPIFERFLLAKEQEWTAYRRHISLWELEQYLVSA